MRWILDKILEFISFKAYLYPIIFLSLSLVKDNKITWDYHITQNTIIIPIYTVVYFNKFFITTLQNLVDRDFLSILINLYLFICLLHFCNASSYHFTPDFFFILSFFSFNSNQSQTIYLVFMVYKRLLVYNILLACFYQAF